MKNLATTELQAKSLPQRTFRRETTMPRQGTDAPDLEVNARIQRPDTSAADELSRVLGLVNEVGQGALKQIADERDKKDGAAASLDFATGVKDEERFGKSWAYYESYQREGAKNLAINIATQARELVQDRLNNEDDPATPEDIDEVLEGVFKSHIFDENGKLLDFGTPEAKGILARALSETRASLIPEALKTIGARQDERMLATTLNNFVTETYRGAEIGAEPKPAAEVDPLAPLPEGTEESPRPAKTVGRKLVSMGKPTGQLPVKGAITATRTAHLARGSEGVDIDGRIGDPVVLPAGGKVVKVSSDGRAGKYVTVDHGNGVMSSYSHLSSQDVKVGQFVQAGARIGAVGNTGNVRSRGGGDGSHLHWRVKVNGKDIDPLAHRFAEGGTMFGDAGLVAAETGSEPQLLAPGEANATPALAGPAPPQVDFEVLMSRLPPSIDRGQAKRYFVQGLINVANERRDPRILDGLTTSVRKDGTPSFTPEEVATVQQARETIDNKRRAEFERNERELFERNHEQLMEALLSENPPSADFIRKAAFDGKIKDSFALSLIDGFEREAKAEARMATQEAKAAQAEVDAELDVEVDSMIVERTTGILKGASPEDDQRLFESGALGSGRKAIARFRRLRAASKAGEQAVMRDPQVAHFASRLEQQFKPKTERGNGRLLMKARGGGAGGNVNYDAMIAHYDGKVRAGETPEAAYRSAIQAWGNPKQMTPAQRQERLRELTRKRVFGQPIPTNPY